MKKLFFLFFFNFSIFSFSQTENFFNYQGVARELSGNPIVNKQINLRFSIIESPENGLGIYSETHNVTTSNLGLFSVKIGLGSIVFGDFKSINWSTKNHFVKVEIDLENKLNYTLIGISQLASVPYALYAQNSYLSVFDFDQISGKITHNDGKGNIVTAVIVSSDTNNSLKIGSDGGAFFPKTKSTFSQNVKTGDIINDDGEGVITNAKIISQDKENSIKVGADGGALFKKTKPTFNQNTTTGDIIHDDGEGVITNAKVISHDKENSIKVGTDGGALFKKTKSGFKQNKKNGDVVHDDGEGVVNTGIIISSDKNNSIEVGADGGAYLSLSKIDGQIKQISNQSDPQPKKCIEVFKRDPNSVDDTETIQFAIDKAGSNNCICLEPQTTYILTSSIKLKDYQNLAIIGNMSTIKRADSDKTTTKLTRAYSGGNTITVENGALFKIGELINLILGTDGNQIGDFVKITKIDGNTITLLTSFKKTYGGENTYPTGTLVGKNFSLISGLPSADDTNIGNAGSNKHITIQNIIFDGNGINNQINHSWTYCNAISLHGEGSEITNCKFIDIGNECIVGHGISVNNNHFEGGDGSAFHTSVNDQTLEENTPSFFNNNTVENFNRISTKIGGHSEGAITFSWGAGYLTVSNNYFRNDNTLNPTSLLGGFGSPTGENPDQNLIFIGNQVYDYTSIFHFLNPDAKNVVIHGNIFSNCGKNSFSRLTGNTGVKFCGNLYSDGTVVEIPESLKCN